MGWCSEMESGMGWCSKILQAYILGNKEHVFKFWYGCTDNLKILSVHWFINFLANIYYYRVNMIENVLADLEFVMNEMTDNEQVNKKIQKVTSKHKCYGDNREN